MNKYEDYFYYDETSPTCLRWKVEKLSGKDFQRKSTKIGGVAGGLRKGENGAPKKATVFLNGVHLMVHNVVWSLFNLEVPHGMVIDHLDGNPWNNKIENLQYKTTQHNCHNKKARCTRDVGLQGTGWTTYAGQLYAVAYWSENKKPRSRKFSVRTYGLIPAQYKACEFRMKTLLRLNDQGAKYTERHIGIPFEHCEIYKEKD